jgi:hypothetical protein
MSQSEYLIVFVSILIGLGLSDLMSSLRDLVQPKRDVRWHGLPMIWAVTVLGYVLAVWWMLFRLLRLEMWYHPVAFLPVLVMVLTLYLLCAFALPDADPETKAAGPKAVDLESFYLSKAHRRWFFGTAAIFSFLFFATFNAAVVSTKLCNADGGLTGIEVE